MRNNAVQKTEQEISELNQMYQGTIWQISPDNPPYDKNAFQVEWQEMKLKKD